MDTIGNVMSSNAVHLLLTFFFGASLSLLPVRKLILPTGAIIAVGIVISFTLLIGEVYLYSDTYRRAFFVFGDEITTVIGFVLLFAIAAKRPLMTLIALTAVLMSGGKVSFVLILLMLFLFFLIQRESGERRPEAKRLLALSAIAAMIYIACQALSLQLMNTQAFNSTRNHIASGLEEIGKSTIGKSTIGSRPPKIGTACATMSNCMESQISNPFLQRYYTSLAGLWMTLQGGFPGARYPGTPEKFADFMIAANPWGMNDRYNLTWNSWHWMGSVQNPYLGFGSGYGPFALLGLGLFLFAMAYLAWDNLRNGEPDTSSAFSIFFIVNVTMNWTQSWLMSGSPILIILGLCCSQILISAALRRDLPPAGRDLLERLASRQIRTGPERPDRYALKSKP